MTTDVEQMIIHKLDKIEVLIAGIFEKQNGTEKKLAVVETEYDAFQESCKNHHRHDGDLTRTAVAEMVKFVVIVVATIVAVRWGMKP